MKYIKLFMLMAVVSMFAACSDDDNYNSRNDVVLEFASTTLTVKESSGIVNVPVKVSGARNGDVSFAISVSETGNNPAKEDVHYMITDKTVNLKADTLKSGVMNVEVKVVDDAEINDERTFRITLTSVKGAKLGTNESTVITIRDNDALFYEQFFGKWTLKAKQPEFGSDGHPTGNVLDFSTDVTISGSTDEESADYDQFLTASAPGMFNVGVNLDCTWRFRYSFDKETKRGTLAFICGELVATYGSNYKWIWATDDGTQYTTDDITAPWALAEGDVLPKTITFPAGQSLYLYQPGAGFWDTIYDITLVKK